MALAISVGGHTLTGGTLLAPETLAGIAAASAGLSWALSGRRWTGRELAGVLVLVQAVIHLVFVAAPHGVLADLEPTMLTGHVAATGLCVYVLSRAEATLWRLAETYVPHPLTAINTATAGSRRPRPLPTILSWPGVGAKKSRLLIVDAPLRAPPRPV